VPEHVGERPPEHADDRRFDLVRRKRRHAILQQRELVRDVGRQEVAPRRQHLSELDEDRPEVFQRAPQADAARQRKVAPEQRGANDRPECAHPRMSEGEVVETVPQRYDDDPEEPTQPHGPDCTGALQDEARAAFTRGLRRARAVFGSWAGFHVARNRRRGTAHRNRLAPATARFVDWRHHTTARALGTESDGPRRRGPTLRHRLMASTTMPIAAPIAPTIVTGRNPSWPVSAKPRPDHEYRQRRVMDPEMRRGEARLRSGRIRVIDDADDRERREAEQVDVRVHRRQDELVRDPHDDAHRHPQHQVKRCNLDQACAHWRLPQMMNV
jgi:hypothetical protein